MQEISKETARRFILGRQGLWPGRRWQGQAGVEQALRNIEAVQIDTISVVAHNQDLALWSRVRDYRPEMLNYWLYQERRFFEYGGILYVYPLDEWPYRRTIMERGSPWRTRAKQEHAEAIEFVRDKITQAGPLASRDFKDRERVPGGFNTVKDTSHALEYLWISGELMIHSRRGMDRVFDLTERLHPHHAVAAGEITDEEADAFFQAKVLRDIGLGSPGDYSRRFVNFLRRHLSPTQCAALLARQAAEGKIGQVKVESLKDFHYYPIEAAGELEDLANDRVPSAWQPLGTDTSHEVNFLAPLDAVIWDRARVKTIFDFEYTWEVYKPQAIRRWGYYTMPILYGDRLVGRFDPKLERKTGRLTLQGFWLDDETLAEDADFAQALTKGLAHFARFHEAKELDASVINYPVLQTALGKLSL